MGAGASAFIYKRDNHRKDGPYTSTEQFTNDGKKITWDTVRNKKSQGYVSESKDEIIADWWNKEGKGGGYIKMKKGKKMTAAERLAIAKKKEAAKKKNEDKNKDSAEKTPNWTKD